MSTRDLPPEKNFLIRCPKLGHQIYFTYCCQENLGKPCPKTLDCWHYYFNVVAYLQSRMSSEEWEETFVRPPKTKMLSLVELIEKAQEAKKKR